MSRQIFEDAPLASLRSADRTGVGWNGVVSHERMAAQAACICTCTYNTAHMHCMLRSARIRASQSILTTSTRPPLAYVLMASSRLTKAAVGPSLTCMSSLAAALAVGMAVARCLQPGVEAPAVRPTG